MIARPSRMRLQRLRACASLHRLSRESGIPMGPLSEAERGIRRLRPDEEERRVEALGRLRRPAREATK